MQRDGQDWEKRGKGRSERRARNPAGAKSRCPSRSRAPEPAGTGSVLPSPPGQDAARWPNGSDPRFSRLTLSCGALGGEEKQKRSRGFVLKPQPANPELALSPVPFLAARGSAPAWTRTRLLGRRRGWRRGARASFAAALGCSCKSPKCFCSVSQGPGAAERPALALAALPPPSPPCPPPHLPSSRKKTPKESAFFGSHD